MGKVRLVIVAVLGVALAVYLVLNTGLGAVFSAAIAIGWSGFAILCLYALGLFVVLGVAWRVLVPESAPAPLHVVIWARMVRDSASDLLPFSHIGGMVFGVRAAIAHGISPPVIFASMIADVTTETLAQLAFVALGVGILGACAPQTTSTASVMTAFILGLAAAVAGGGVLLAVRRRGAWVTRKIAGRLFPDAVLAGEGVIGMLEEIYRSPRRIALSLALHFFGWVTSAIGAWIAFRMMGAQVRLISVVAIEGLVGGMRSVAFLVPNAIGVQEAAYVVLAPLFGIGAEFALGVSVLKRARDIAVGIPILLIWQGVEGQRAIARAR